MHDVCAFLIFPLVMLFVGIRLNVSESGLAATVRLSNGDMRKALNILQVLRSLLVFFYQINHYVSIC